MLEIDLICEILDFSKKYNKSTSIQCNSPEAIQNSQKIYDLSQLIFNHIPAPNRKDIKVVISRGRGSYPRVTWLGFLPDKRRISKSLSVTTCFSRNGEGIVCGLMAPSNNHFHVPTVQRTIQKNYLDIDGMSSLTKYNNQFINPIEFYLTNFRLESYVNHIIKSLEMLNHSQ